MITNPDPNAEPIFPLEILHDRWHNEVAKDLRRVRLSDLELDYEGENDIEPDIEHEDHDPEAWKDGDAHARGILAQVYQRPTA